MRQYQLKLTAEQVAELSDAQNHHKLAYVRERAAAILKVSEGLAVKQVARGGLLRRHKPHTVSGWIKRYLAEGLPGLVVRKGRGRKPVFSPSGGDRRPQCRGAFTAPVAAPTRD